MFKSILVPFDGSAGAEKALKMAIDLVKTAGENARLNILTVYRHHSMLEASLSMVRPNEPGNLDDIMREHATEVADRAKKMAITAGCEDVHAFVSPGGVARTIVKSAEKHETDLIVIGSRGMGSVEDYLLGSVSHKVTGLAKCPVLVV
ncbi:TRAP-T-associated universal stress protein TeaD (plasmid) [Maritalea myrionectae]|uniref:TRAP-T-associated universal stress protein TeaD n=1 Tax=Maritalea myrionectae TaxID=454601 RepID=A0A2R4MJU1_9HYPH|nr:universal stress protein [Maritalea myrionectae]AVX06186.1 TRAP-T-associated universal stress protein TeaD [Maritalea myrionectae]